MQVQIQAASFIPTSELSMPRFSLSILPDAPFFASIGSKRIQGHDELGTCLITEEFSGVSDPQSVR